MNVLIVGMGRTGSYLGNALAETGTHRVVAIESDESRAGEIVDTRIRVLLADGCEPSVLEEAGVRNSDLVVATTGDDEDNLVISQLAKLHFGVDRVIARVNNPRNHWLYNKEWGVDVAVSPTDIITKIIEEEMSLGDLVTLLKLKGGKVALAEITLSAEAKATGKKLSDLQLPHDSVIVVVMRGGEVIVPGGQTILMEGDELLAVTSVEKELDLKEALQ
ncbi:MAG: potassium channel family protein [Thermoleophilia bacterium]